MAVHPCPLPRGDENQGRPGATFEIASRIIKKREGVAFALIAENLISDGTAAAQQLAAFRERTAGWLGHRLNDPWFEPNRWRGETFRLLHR